MFLLYIIISLSAFNVIDSKKSFTIVIDTTGSMKDELEIIKTNFGTILNDLVDKTEFEDYIIVTFNDPDVGILSIAHTPKELLDNLNTIKSEGGVECPENSIAGIKKALEISEPGSTIYVFTDAYAQDYGNIIEVTDLCINKKIQVLIFLSGVCLTSTRSRIGNVYVYYDIVDACSGAVLRLDTANNLRQAFPYIMELNRINWNDVSTHGSFSERKELTFKIDTFTTDFMVLVSGDRPQVQILNVQGQAPRIMKVIDTKNTQVLRLVKPDTGDYTVYITCQGQTSASMYRMHHLPYKYGFSTKQPKTLIETSLRPMPGRTNYVLICSSRSSSVPATMEFTDGRIKTQIKLDETEKSGVYIASVYIESGKTYRISITFPHSSTNQEMFGTTKLIIPQKLASNVSWTKPSSIIIKEHIDVVEYGGNLTIACKVHGYPKPRIQWKDDNGRVLISEEILLEIPSIYVSYVTIQNLTSSSTVYCKCENSVGEAMDSTDIVVKRRFIFEVKQKPKNTSIEYGSEGMLYCEVNSYPEAVIKWYHNDTQLDASDNIQFKSEENSLVIRNIRLEDAGVYTCEIKKSQRTESYNAVVTITGLEVPQVDITEKEVVSKPGDELAIECRITKGQPAPIIIWTYKSEINFDFGNLPEGVSAQNDKLRFSSIELNHKGVYKCEAFNPLGQHFSEVNLKIEYSPIIEKGEVSKITVRDGENVELLCKVSASPKALVRWEMSQDDVICNLDSRHTTDFRNTHHFTASWNDSGNYHCIAENSIGRAEKTITLNVLVAPYIEPTKSSTISVAVGNKVQLLCNVLLGNPAPTLKWQFIAPNIMSSILKRDNTTNVLSISKVSKSNEGWYICIVENEIGSDTIKYYVKVQ